MTKRQAHRWSRKLWKAISEISSFRDLQGYTNINYIKLYFIQKLKLPLIESPYCYMCDYYTGPNDDCDDCPIFGVVCSGDYVTPLAYYRCIGALRDYNFSDFKKYARELYKAIPRI